MYFKAAIFDLDGLLIDSEPLWREAQTSIYRSLAVPITGKNCADTMGLRVDEAVQYWFDKFPWQGPSRAEVAALIVDGLVSLVEKEGTPMPGVMEALNLFSERNIPIAIASSSSKRIIAVAVKRLNIEKFVSVISSGENEKFGKPHPGVYLSCLKDLNIEARFCVAFEDTLPGLKAAKAAGLTCICVPDSMADPGLLGAADLVLTSLSDLTEYHLENLGKRAGLIDRGLL